MYGWLSVQNAPELTMISVFVILAYVMRVANGLSSNGCYMRGLLQALLEPCPRQYPTGNICELGNPFVSSCWTQLSQPLIFVGICVFVLKSGQLINFRFLFLLVDSFPENGLIPRRCTSQTLHLNSCYT